MNEPEDKEEGDAEPDERLEEAKKTADAFAMTVIALFSSGILFWVVNLAYSRWNIDPGQDLLFVVVWIACQPMICLLVYHSTAQSAFIERAFKASVYICLATAGMFWVGFHLAHVACHGQSHWDCLDASQVWQDRHPEIRGTIAAFRCGAAECSREEAFTHESPRMVVEFDSRAWYEVRFGQPGEDCRTVAFNLKPGAWLPNLGGRVAAAPDICHSILPRSDAAWHPIR